MKKRHGKGIWQGLFDFYTVETKRAQKAAKVIEQDATLKNLKTKDVKAFPLVKHILSHQLLSIQFLWIKLEDKSSFSGNELEFYSNKEVKNLPKPIVISRFLEDEKFITKA